MAKKTPSRVRPTEAYLLDYSAEHVPYEIQLCLFQCWFVCSNIESVPKHLRPWTVGMALLDAMALHARNLIDLLYPRHIRPNDVIAADFFDDPEEWENTRPELSDRLEELRKKVDKQVAHLTTERISGTPPEKSYRLEDFAELFEVLRLFAKHASPSRLHQNVRKLVPPQ